MEKKKEFKCKICEDFGFYQNISLEWIPCPRCLLKSDYKRLIKDE